jgi:hypothetical protein
VERPDIRMLSGCQVKDPSRSTHCSTVPHHVGDDDPHVLLDEERYLISPAIRQIRPPVNEEHSSLEPSMLWDAVYVVCVIR